MEAFDSTTIRTLSAFVRDNVNIKTKIATFAYFFSNSCLLINITTCNVERSSHSLSLLHHKRGDSLLSGTCVLESDGLADVNGNYCREYVTCFLQTSKRI